MNWWKGLKGKIKFREPLKRHTTFKIGGPARFFIIPKDIADLRLSLGLAQRNRVPLLILGAGSNILAPDSGVNAAVIKLEAEIFRKLSYNRNFISAGSGMNLQQLLTALKIRGLSGLEFLAGIPGTVGGAIMMNAGAWGKQIADYLENIEVMDYNGNIKILPKKDIKFGYRSCSLADKFIILNATFRLLKATRRGIEEKIKTCLLERISTQDLSRPSAGCIFKNPKNYAAGKLIDLCGLKGRAAGGAVVSLRHANFILNRKDATAADILKLMRLAEREVKNKFKINLEPEIKIW